MNTDEKKAIIDLLITIKLAIQYAMNNERESNIYIYDSCEGLYSVKNYLSSKDIDCEYSNLLKLISKLMSCKLITDINVLNYRLEECEIDIENIITNMEKTFRHKMKILFITYKASMWTALESIWKAAKNDYSDCEVIVLPIPYHELDEVGAEIKLCYEGEKYPEYVEIKKFWEYDIPEENPDVIFIHNPYDDGNNLTRIPSEYYSRNLKKYTNMLVYSPYNTFAVYKANQTLSFCLLEGVKNADIVIAQSERVKKVYEAHGHKSEKILAVGSPKIDSVINFVKNPPQLPVMWTNKMKEKKVILLNTTLTFFVQFGEAAIARVLEVYRNVTEMNNCFLIWRPHPLEEMFIKKNKPEILEYYKKLILEFDSSPNSIVDKNSDYKYAFSISKAMFSTHSSLINEYMATGKPVFILQGLTNKKESFVNYEYNYYIFETDMNEFVKFSLVGEDPLFKERMKAYKEAFLNGSDGTCGERLYEIIKNKVLEKEI